MNTVDVADRDRYPGGVVESIFDALPLWPARRRRYVKEDRTPPLPQGATAPRRGAGRAARRREWRDRWRRESRIQSS